MSTLLSRLLEAVYPPSCAACGRAGAEPFCEICGEALLPAAPFAIPGALGARALFAFGGPIADAIHRLKYRDRPELARPLGRLMQAGLTSLDVEAAVPVPSTPRRTIRRGYNHAQELARHLGLPVLPRALVRTVERPQVGLGRKERRENLIGAFRPGADRCDRRAVVLIDDVVTTGATAEAAVHALQSAGARAVFVLALAREE